MFIHKLPVEILNQIFVLLHQQHKVQCMAVCRHWQKIIKESVLFHTVRISSINQMNQVMKKFRQEPILGAKVERLILDLKPSDNFKIDNIPLLLPNLRVFIAFNIDEKADYNRMQTTKNLTPHPWQQSIEHIAEYVNSMHTFYVLNSGPCPNLTNLTLYWDDHKPGKTLVELLTNASALIHLKISGSNFTLQDFESLHECVPLLKSLSVENAQLMCDSIPFDCEPAYHVTKVNFTAIGVDSATDEVAFLLYIRSKYPNMVDFSYSLVILDEIEFESDEGYNHGFLPLMESLETQLTTLKLGLNAETVFPFNLLDEADCQIRKLTLGLIVEEPTLEELAHTCQVLFIRTLITHYILDYSSLDWLSEFMNLRELVMAQPFRTEDGSVKKLNLNHVLDMLGNTLELLSVRGVELTFDLMKTRTYRIKEFSFDSECMTPQLDTFISQSFPNLRSLTFQSWNWSNSSFILPNVDLSYLEITDRRLKDSDKILVITLNNIERRWYSTKQKYDTKYTKYHVNNNDAPALPAITSLPFDKFTGKPYMTVVCNSVNTLFLLNTMN